MDLVYAAIGAEVSVKDGDSYRAVVEDCLYFWMTELFQAEMAAIYCFLCVL